MRQIPAESPINLSQYQLIDSGDYEKLERFGSVVLARPEPQAIWPKALGDDEWTKLAHAWFEKDAKSNEKGHWHLINWPQNALDSWWMGYEYEGIKITMKLWLSSFKHVGIFPEQAANWDYMIRTIREMQVGTAMTDPISKPRVLNLFGYTGAASLAACAVGAEVTHLDAVKQVVTIARESMEASHLDGIRWVVDDALKFVKREQRRGNTYHGIVLDPPAYGRGPDGEKWVLEDHLQELLMACRDLLDPQSHFLILNLYSLGFSALISESLGRSIYTAENTEQSAGELYLEDDGKRSLPLGTFLRVRKR